MKQQQFYYCRECGCWITSAPLGAQEAQKLRESFCPDCLEPLKDTMIVGDDPRSPQDTGDYKNPTARR